MNREEAIYKRDIIVTQIINELGVTIETNTKPLIRCKDCKWYKKIVEKSKSGLCQYDLVARCLHDEDYCSHGERREL